KKTIVYDEFLEHHLRYVEFLRQEGTEVSDEMSDKIKKQIFQDMVVQEIFNQSAENYAMMVTDFELARYISSIPAFSPNGTFNREIYNRTLWRNFKMRPAQFELQERRRILSERFKNLLLSTCKVTPSEILHAFVLQGKSFKDFEKEKKTIALQMKQYKFIALANYQIGLFKEKKGLLEFFEAREQERG
ncbi:MAG TPA: SurA N-terminal domain-containing protein, partial [Elusimicrobiales bacterium]|nr:SurA N-terminal domain-containing protein [Elusimicrobiales bacterium]